MRNYNDMTKEEKIKEAYGEYWDSVSRHHQYEGWINRWAWDFRNDLEMDELSGKDSPSLVRPKSLQGIENNNGWIKIESEADLPKTSNDFLVYNKEKEILIKAFIPRSIISSVWLQEITHYQPIEKPKPPLY